MRLCRSQTGDISRCVQSSFAVSVRCASVSYQPYPYQLYPYHCPYSCRYIPVSVSLPAPRSFRLQSSEGMLKGVYTSDDGFEAVLDNCMRTDIASCGLDNLDPTVVEVSSTVMNRFLTISTTPSLHACCYH